MLPCVVFGVLFWAPKNLTFAEINVCPLFKVVQCALISQPILVQIIDVIQRWLEALRRFLKTVQQGVDTHQRASVELEPVAVIAPVGHGRSPIAAGLACFVQVKEQQSVWGIDVVSMGPKPCGHGHFFPIEIKLRVVGDIGDD